MMAVRFVALLLLCLTEMLLTEQSTGNRCNINTPVSCNNSRIKLSHPDRNKYNIEMYFNDQCLTLQIKCTEFCKEETCESKVDNFFNNCQNGTHVETINRFITATAAYVESTPVLGIKTVTQNCSTFDISPTSQLLPCDTSTVKLTVSPTCPPCQSYSASSAIYQPSKESQNSSNLESNTNTMVLGALLGLSILLLIVVTTGWICTCWLTKTKKRDVVKNKEPRGTADLHRDDEEERVFNNPTYGGESMTEQLTPGPSEYETPDRGQQKSFSRVTYAMYEAVKLPKSQRKTVQSGQTYDRLDRESVNGGQVSVRGVTTANNDASYSQLGLQDQDVVNNYHVIKKDNNE